MFRSLRISHKLWLAVLILVILLVAVVGFAGYRSSKSQAQADLVMLDLAERVESALRWQGLTETNAARTEAMIVSSDPAVEAQFKETIPATSARISELQKRLQELATRDVDKAQMARIAQARTAMLELRKKAVALKSAGQHDEAMELIGQQYNPASASYLRTLHEFAEMQRAYSAERKVELGQDRLRTVQIAGVMVLGVLLAIVVGTQFLIRTIQQPLLQASGLAGRIARGDLSARASDSRRGDEFGELLASLEAMRASLARMVAQVRSSTDSIATASDQIAAGNQDLSARTESTSSNLQQTAAAMEEFTSTIAQSAGSASQASQLASSARDVAQRGGAVVSEVVSTMEAIQASSRKISDIIGVIDGIAFQTNILALNAAVEAARAGEQGRGFAVVAGEVRTLAQRAATAAREIKGLIDVSVENVESGSRLVQQAGGTMGEIVQSVQRVADMIGEVTAAAAEQSAGVGQVNQAVGQLDRMTQQNAALVEQSAAAAQSLREQAQQLAQVVSVFKVEDGGGAPAERQSGPPLRRQRQRRCRLLPHPGWRPGQQLPSGSLHRLLALLPLLVPRLCLLPEVRHLRASRQRRVPTMTGKAFDEALAPGAPADGPGSAGGCQASSAISSISTQAPMGICATPKALRACLPASPKTWPMSSLAPLVTRCCSVKSPVELTRLMSLTMRLTRFRSPPVASCSVPSRSMATARAAALPSSVPMSRPSCATHGLPSRRAMWPLRKTRLPVCT